MDRYLPEVASFEDAASGWAVFRARSGEVTRAQLNQALRAQGRQPISDRTYAHYQKLLRLGYSEYVSINRLDIRHANDSIFDISDRSRYLENRFDGPGTLLVPQASDFVQIDGTIVRVSEGFAVLRVPTTTQAIKLARATKYDRGILIFTEVDVERPVRVVEAVPAGQNLDLLVEFRSLLETDLVLRDSGFRSGAAEFSIDLGPNTPFFRVLETAHATFDLLESSRGFVQVAAQKGSPEPTITPQFRVVSLEFSNPFEGVVVGSLVAIHLVTWIIDRVSNSFRNVTEARSALAVLQRHQDDAHRADEIHELQMQALQLEKVKKQIEVVELFAQVAPEVQEVIGAELPALDAAQTARLEALKDQAVEAALELEASSNGPITFSRRSDDVDGQGDGQ